MAKGGLDALGEALVRRAQERQAEHQRLIVAHERRRQELAACETAGFDEQRILQSISRLGSLLQNLEPNEQKELIQLFIKKVELRSARQRETENQRLLSLRIKLALPQLVQGVEARARNTVKLLPVADRTMTFESRIDFTRAAQGEVTIIAPFEHRIGDSAAEPAAYVPVPTQAEHAVVRARRWQEMLETGQAANRVELAKLAGMTPGVITRIMKLIELSPEIQSFLASLRSIDQIRRFPIKKVGALGVLPAEEQNREFARMKARIGL